MQPKELLSLAPGWGQAFLRVSSAGGILTVQGQEVPTRVHARRGARWRGRGVIHLSNNPTAWGPSAGRCKDPTDLRWEAAGGWVQDTAPPPGPANRRFSPPPPGDRERIPSGGPGRLANPGRGSGQLGAPGPEIVRSLPLPPPPPPTQALSLRRAACPTPCLWAPGLTGLWVMWERIRIES